MTDPREQPHARCASLSRRAFLERAGTGFGAVAASALFGGRSLAHAADGARRDPLTPRAPHFAPRARNVIFLYMDGGVSQVDSFDPKPRLARENGQPIRMRVPETQFDAVGGVLQSPWTFRRYGESGLEVSDLFPHVGRHADKLCVVRSMTSKFPEHTFANYFLHTGHGIQGRPSMGAWVGYGLGSEADDLPGFVVLNGGLTPVGGLDNFSAGFLPASFQGSVFRDGPTPLANATPPEGQELRQRRKLDLLARLDTQGLAGSSLGDDPEVEAALQNYELAFRMQAAVPDLVDLGQESAATQALYGLDQKSKGTATFARQCLLARRLVERGVRFVELTCPHVGHDRWDQHGNLKQGHEDNARAVDQPIAALLHDLDARGLLDTTLVVWTGEFGRTPMAQGTNGRDHNPHGFSLWLAGGGVRGGHVHGATDDYGYFAVQDKVELHDLHATMLHLLGFDHTRLSILHGGREMRLTDVHGHVVHDWLA